MEKVTKTILVDAVDCFVSDTGKIFGAMQELLVERA